MKRISWSVAVLLLAIALDAAAAGPSGPHEVEGGTTWDCVGLPCPGDGIFKTFPAWVDAAEPDAMQRAIERARRGLLDTLCGGRSDCGELAASIQAWRQGRGNGQVCALAVIEESAYRKWRRKASPAGLLAQIAPAAEQLLEKVGWAGRSPRFAFSVVKDDGVPGGPRVETLLRLMALALQDAGATQVFPDRTPSRAELPRGVDINVDGELVSHAGGKVLVTWGAFAGPAHRRGKEQYMNADPFIVAASDLGVAPKKRFSSLPPSSDALRVDLECRAGGGLCVGQTTQLYVRSNRERHVRVIELFGDDEAIVIFPNGARPKDVVPAKRRVPMGDAEGFVAYPGETEAELFLILAAEREADLGVFAGMRDHCRVPPDVARRLHRGEGLPPRAVAASTGYRVRSDGACPPPSTAAPSSEAIEAWLRRLPECSVR